ncbi:MAG: riboflavin biosynthesis protein RibF [Oscillospiraceae bacterium]
MHNLTQDGLIPQQRCAVALGLFDGVHIGHQAVIRRAASLRARGYAAAVFTFQTDSVTSKGRDGRLEMLLSDEMKWEKFERLGVDYLYTPPFSALKDMPPEEFVRSVLRGRLNACAAVCGEDFRFGRGARGDCYELKALGARYGIDVEILTHTVYHGAPVSSTAIRQAVRAGEIESANAMLGYPFGFRLPVVHGNAIGRKLNFPTINQLIPNGLVLPRFGVYAANAMVNGVSYRAVTNVGVKPTVSETDIRPCAETYLIDFNGDLYGQTVDVGLIGFLRAEQKFPSLEALKEQIAADLTRADAFFSQQADSAE